MKGVGMKKAKYTYKVTDNEYAIYKNGKRITGGGIFINRVWVNKTLNRKTIKDLLTRKARRDIKELKAGQQIGRINKYE